MKIKLKPIDLSKCGRNPKHREQRCWHPDIKGNKQYLALIGGDFFAGSFSNQWYGWNFDAWGCSGLQLDKPGTNCSEWKGLWEITATKGEK